jgi:hypothetical protein
MVNAAYPTSLSSAKTASTIASSSTAPRRRCVGDGSPSTAAPVGVQKSVGAASIVVRPFLHAALDVNLSRHAEE